MLVLALLGLALAADPPTVEAAPGEGVEISSADGRFALRVSARLQLRQTVSLTAEDEVKTLVQVRTARLMLGGHLLNADTKYFLALAFGEGDFRDTARSPVLDAGFDLTHARDASVRVGQMFVPFDRSRTTSDAALQLPNRSVPVNEFNLDRGIGAYAYSDRFVDSPFAWRLGVFASNGLHLTVDQTPGAIFVARAELRPLGSIDDNREGDQARREEPGLAIGVAGAYSLATSRVRSTNGLFYPNGTVDYAHFTADVTFKWRGFALLGEVIGREADEDSFTNDDGTFWTRSGWGFVAQPSYAFTRHLELVARYAEVTPFEGTDPDFERQQEVGSGLNLYISGHAFKVQADWQAIWSDDFGDAVHSWHAVTDVSF